MLTYKLRFYRLLAQTTLCTLFVTLSLYLCIRIVKIKEIQIACIDLLVWFVQKEVNFVLFEFIRFLNIL